MKRRLTILLLILLPIFSIAQRQKFQLNGAARGYYFSNNLDIAQADDSISTRKANYGQTLLDLGFSLFPNENTEVIGMFRIRNDLGGFWGGGVSFNVRQLTLKGVAADIVRYELGDIDLKVTPYTLFNPLEEGVVNEADVFALRRDIVHYDMFYTDDNTWRMQGGVADFGLEFNKGIQELNFKGFLTRQRATDGIAAPERLFGGGTVKAVQSDMITVSLNSVNVFDLSNTIQDSLQYKNNVYSGNVEFGKEVNEDLKAVFNAEAGMSNARYLQYQDVRAPEDLNEWFYDAAVGVNVNKLGLELRAGYKDVGADFRSPGAQTKRIDYSKFPGVYQQYTNNAIGRPLSYTDVISGNTDNSFKISEELLAYNVAYNNTNPYGLATPNRRGFYLTAVREDSVKFTQSFVRAAMLMQSRGTGTSELKNFILVEAGTDVYLNNFWDGENDLKLDLGVRFESTSRGGQVFEAVDLTSTMLDLGLTFEIAENLDILGGAKMWMVSGNELYNVRNVYNTVENFNILTLDFSENVYAGGLRYRFSETNTLSAQYQMFNIDHNTAGDVDYGISQFTILYSLFF